MKLGPGTRVVCLAVLLVGACAKNQPEIKLSEKSALELRAMQSRAFETNDQARVLRAVIATFQDLGYSIEKVEASSGTVTADKLAKLKVTATIYQRNADRTIVRSNAIVKLNPSTNVGHQVDAPEFYQIRFFEPLAKALFLTALQIEDEPLSDNAVSAPTTGGDEPDAGEAETP